MFECIEYQVKEKVAVISIDQIHDDNRVNRETLDEIIEAMDLAASDAKVAVLILTGKGEFFCTGGRMNGFPDGLTMDMKLFAESFIGLQQAIYRFPKPVIAAVNGNAVAGGLAIMDSCDMAIVGNECRFGLPELARGNFPMLALAIMQKSLPKKLVFELAYGCELMDAETARSWNLVNRIVPQNQVLEEALKFAGTLAEYNAVAASLGRQAYYTMQDMSLTSAIEYGKSTLITMLTTEDVKEAHHALEDGRKPNYRGV